MQTSPPKPWCIAHRGARDEAPENTRSAFERALQYPVDGIELDVRMSADGIPVVFHDDDLRRVTGGRERIEDLTAAQLDAVDWGRWFDPAFGGEAMLTLEQALALFAPRTRLLIEIKSSPAQQRSGHSERLTRRVVDLLAALPGEIARNHIFILSFGLEVLRLAHDLAQDGRCVYNAPEFNPQQARTLPPADLERLWAVDIRIGRLSLPLVEWAHRRGLRVFTYTCNDPRQVQKALRMGVDGILSDRPGWLTQCVKG